MYSCSSWREGFASDIFTYSGLISTLTIFYPKYLLHRGVNWRHHRVGKALALRQLRVQIPALPLTNSN